MRRDMMAPDPESFNVTLEFRRISNGWVVGIGPTEVYADDLESALATAGRIVSRRYELAVERFDKMMAQLEKGAE